MKFISLFICLFILATAFAQESLLSTEEIESNERKVVTAFKRYIKKPKRKKRKEKFLKHYNQSLSKHRTRLHLLQKIDQVEDRNWEGILNELKSLRYLNILVNSSKTTLSLETTDYHKEIDSISSLAIEDLYNRGKSSYEKNENVFSMEIAYNYLRRARQIRPNYKDTQSIIDLAVKKGTKKVYFKPVTYDNLGNYIEWGSDNSSVSSDFIITKLKNDLSVNIVGSHFINTRFDADRILELKWTSIDISPERNNKYSVTRSKKIKEDGQEKTIHVTVNYNERFKDVTGEMLLAIKDVKANYYLISETVSGTTFFSEVEANYTGDKRALTNEDWNAIDNTNHTFNLIINEGFELTTKMYTDAIHEQILEHIGRLLNWNFKLD